MRTQILYTSALLALAVPVCAQFETATVLGTVADVSHAAVSGARLSLKNVDTGVVDTVSTDGAGSYQFLDVRIGRYQINVQQPGFKSAATQPFTVTVGARQRVDLVLEVGDVAQSVTVADAASSVESASSDRGQVIAAAIVNLPLNGRNYADLSLLSPGVRKSMLGNLSARDGAYNVNGLRSAFNNFIIDGVDNNAYGTSNQGFSYQVVQASPDAVQEFRIDTSNYSAEYGRAGGAVVNASIRSGTNQFHAVVYDYLRNTALNATGFFKPTGNVKPTLVQNQFGGTLGGPLRRDKMFFFADYEGYRISSSAVSLLTLPTLAQRSGHLGIPVQNPYTGEVYANGVIPASAIAPFARKVFNDLPVPTNGLASLNFQALPVTHDQSDKGDFKYDQYVGSAITFFGRYSHRLQYRTVSPTIPGPTGAGTDIFRALNQQAVAGLTWTVNPRTLVDVRFGYSRTEGENARARELDGTPDILTLYGIPGLPTAKPIAGGINSQAITGYTAYGRDSGQHQYPAVFNPKVNVSRILSHHTLKAGFEFQAVNTEILDFNPLYGKDTYGGQFSRPKTGAASNNLYNVADFLFGARDSYNLNSYGLLQYRQRMYFGYVQDDWKATRKLTVNLGLRYEFATPQFDANNRQSNFDPRTNSLVLAKDGSLFDRSLVNPDRNNFGPRVGLAYSINPKTVVRSAYGISYLHFQRYGRENLLGYNGPYVVNTLVNQVPSQGVCTPGQDYRTCFAPTQQGYPANLTSPDNFNAAGSNIHYLPSHYSTTYVQAWNLTVQRELARDLVLDLAYVGNRGVHIVLLGDFNQADPNVPGGTLPVDARRPIKGFGIIQAAFPSGNSTYHALQTKVEKRFNSGLFLLNSFTWSKAIDTAPGNMEASGGDNYPVNYRDWSSNKALSDLDQPINNTTSVVYNLPFGHARRYGSRLPGWADRTVGGWNLSFINTYASGLPVTITYTPSAAYSVSSLPTYRPNVQGSIYPAAGQARDNYLNKAAFSVPPTAAMPFGNAGRGIARSPNFTTLDLGIHKRFTLFREGQALEVRGELFNALNRTNFQPPASNISNSTFGIISAAFPARQVQIAAKFIF